MTAFSMPLRAALRGGHSFLAPLAILGHLDPPLAGRKPAGVTHAIAEIVAHMAFWQEWFLDRCDGHHRLPPARAADGWPAVEDHEWPDVLARFETGFSRSLAMAADEAKTGAAVSPPIEFERLKEYTTADALLHVALHNAHHLGQVVILRQQLGAWPPPAGGLTW